MMSRHWLRPGVDLYAHHSIDTKAIMEAAQALVAGKPVRYLKIVGDV